MKYINIFLLWLAPAIASASNPAQDTLKEIGSTKGPYQDMPSGYGISQVVGAGIEAALALIGVIFIVLMLYAGYHWMTARGEEEKVEKAKDTITRAIIGIIIVVGAYAIWQFVFDNLISK